MAHSRTSPALPVPAYADPADQFSLPVTRNGIQYIYDKQGGANGTGEWEAKVSENVTVVTKVTDQSYEHENNQTTSVAHKPNEELLTIPEIDGNFISLKQGIVGVEKELKFLAHNLEVKITTAQSTADNATGSLGNQNSGLATKMPIAAGTAFTGPIFRDTSPGNVTGLPLGDSSNYYVYSSWVQTELQNLTVDLTPRLNNTQNLGSSSNPWSTLHLSDSILPNGNQVSVFTDKDNNLIRVRPVNLGSQGQAFEKLFVKDAVFSGDTITIGQAALSATSSGGVLLPANSSVGTEDNQIPSNFANTLIEERFAESGLNALQRSFEVAGQVASLDPVKLLSDGRVATVNAINTSEAFVGFSTASTSAPNSVNVTIHGIVNGFSGLTAGNLVHLTSAGVVTQTKSTTTIKIGVATSTTQIFLFSTSAIDTYTLNERKIERSDLSVINTTPSGDGALSYNGNTGVFAMTFPDLSSFATQSFVNNEINSLIGGAPGTLDTLNELAAAINDDSNFASSVTSSLTLKAPLASPTLTGNPKAPTPATASNDTSIATTAFVKQQAGSQTLSGLTDVTITSPQQNQVIAYDTSTQKFRNVNQSGVGGAGGTVNFVVDGGTASSVSSDVIITLDGGSA